MTPCPPNAEEIRVIVEVEYVCGVCGRPVEDGQGSLYVRWSDLAEQRQIEEERKQRQGPGRPLDVAAMFRWPGWAMWHIQHDACRPDESDGYDISVEQVRTLHGLLEWTEHLMDKRWLPQTNWPAILQGAVSTGDLRTRESSRGDAA